MDMPSLLNEKFKNMQSKMLNKTVDNVINQVVRQIMHSRFYSGRLTWPK